MTNQTNPHKLITKMFYSLDALAEFVALHQQRAMEGPDSWAGGSITQALEWLRNGNLALVKESEGLLGKFEELAFPTYRREWYNEVSGHVANVPAYLAGHPQAMRRRRRAENPSAPITIFVDTFVSGSFSQEQILARGAMVLALVRILSAHRAVSLYVADACTARDGTTVAFAVRLDTAPLDLAHAAYVLCAPSFQRRITIAVDRGMYPPVGIMPPLNTKMWTLGGIAERMLGEGNQVLVIPGGMVSSTGKLDPRKWIEEKIREAAPEILGEGIGAE